MNYHIERLKELNIEISALLKKDISLALEKAEEMYELALKADNKEYKGQSLIHISYSYFYLREFDKSIMFLEKTLFFYKKHNNPEKIFEIYTSLGVVYRNMGDYEKALTLYLKAISVAEVHNITINPTIYNNIATVYGRQKNYEKALKFYEKALEIHQKKGQNIQGYLINIANIYVVQKQYKKAKPLYDKIKKICLVKNDIVSLVSSLRGQINMTIGQEQYEKAKKIIFEAIYYSEEANFHIERIELAIALAKVYEYEGNIKAGISTLKKTLSLAKEKKSDKVIECLESLIILCKLDEDYKISFLFLEELKRLEKEKYTVAKEKIREELKAQFESDEKDKLIKQEKAYNAKLKARNQKLEEVNEDLRQFNHAVSHDLKQPLRNINTYNMVLLSKAGDKLNDAEKDMIKKSMSNALQTEKMLSDMMAYSTVGNGVQKIEMANLNHIVHAVKNNLDTLINKNDASISIEGVLPTINGYIGMLIQLFQNIIGNAIKYRKLAEKPIIKISCKKQKNRYAISVIDNGVGIAKEHQEKIFNLFSRVGNTTDREGSGIGLSIVKKIAVKHAADICVSSTPNIGSVFTVSFSVY